MTEVLDLALAELRARPEPVPSLDLLAPVSQAAILVAVAEFIASRGSDGVRCLAAREMLEAALRLDPDVRLGLNA